VHVARGVAVRGERARVVGQRGATRVFPTRTGIRWKVLAFVVSVSFCNCVHTWRAAGTSKDAVCFKSAGSTPRWMTWRAQ
jgi:hypothetical protein